MQLLANGRDQVVQSYAEGQLTLHRLVDGTFQFGVGKTASVVQSVEQVKKFAEPIQVEVQRWLASGGYERAIQAKQNLDLAESSKSMPGSIEALAMQIGGQDLLGKLHALLQGVSTGKAPAAPVPTDVLVPDKTAKQVVIAEDEEDDRPFEFGSDMPELTPEERAFPAPTMPAPASAEPSPDLMAAITGIAEGMGSIMSRLEAVERFTKQTQKPKAPARKRVRPSRAKPKMSPSPQEATESASSH